MKWTAVMIACAVAGMVLGYANYRKASAPGADIRVVKTDMFEKDQDRLPQFECTPGKQEVIKGAAGSEIRCEGE